MIGALRSKIRLLFADQFVICLVLMLGMDLARCTLKFQLFVTRFDGSNFDPWRTGMLDALTCLGQALPLQGMDARPESMSDIKWEDLDELARSTIYLHLRGVNSLQHGHVCMYG